MGDRTPGGEMVSELSDEGDLYMFEFRSPF